jgi:protein SCO1/2
VKADSRRQTADSRAQKAVRAPRLGRRTVRKGSAFPTALFSYFGKAAPCQAFVGAASKINLLQVSESHRLSALCRGKAATSLTIYLCLLLVGCIPVFGQFTQSQGNSPLYSSRPYQPRAPIGLPKALNGVGIDQKLNEQLPLDLILKNENGESVKLGDYFGKKPVVLALVYYQCPMLCNQMLNGMVTAFRVMSFAPGKEFEVVTISFDPRETPALAAAKKKTYVDYLPDEKRASAAAGWHFLIADEASIARITSAVGFRYHWDEATSQFAHASAIYVATPQGKLARYFYGIEYAPRDLRLGLIEAAENKIGSPVDQLLLYCFHYDPATGKYGARVMNMMRVGGVITLIALAGLLLALRRRSRAQVAWRARQAGGAA